MQSARACWSHAIALAALLCALSAGGLSQHSARPLPGTHNHPSAVLADTLGATQLASDQTSPVRVAEPRLHRVPAGASPGTEVIDVRPPWLVEAAEATVRAPAYPNSPSATRDRAPPLLV